MCGFCINHQSKDTESPQRSLTPFLLQSVTLIPSPPPPSLTYRTTPLSISKILPSQIYYVNEIIASM